MSAVFAGRGAVVVGGGNGIGLAVAKALATQGAGVVVNSRSDESVGAAVESITAGGGAATGIAGNAAQEAVADRLVAECRNMYGDIDILVNCAGVAEPYGSSILDVTPEQWRDLLDSHLTTVFSTCRVVAPLLAERGRGVIVNTGSFAYLGDYGGTGYPAGKGAVTSLSLAMAAELKEAGVRVNVVCPGAKTRLSTGPEYEEHIRDLNRRGLLDEVTMAGSLDAPPPDYAAALYTYLASDAAQAVTGEIFVAAGNFVGRFARPALTPLAYRDHDGTPPWSIGELDRLIGGH